MRFRILGFLIIILASWSGLEAAAKCTAPTDDDVSPLVCADGSQTSDSDKSQPGPDFSTGGSLASALPCLARSIYSNGSVYNITNSNGDLVATVNATSSSDLASAFQSLVESGQCLKNSISCSRVEGTYSISTQGFQRVFNVVDNNNQILAVIYANKEDDAAGKFAELVNAGVCAGQ